jgi:(p)ppGpp synthase/HD superfamily hydrolase
MKTQIKHDFKTYELCKKVAMDIHAGQTRKFGEDKGKPYFIHPDRVSISLMPSSPSGDYGDACVGVLHDCKEDYNYETLKDAQTEDSIYMAKGYLEMRGVPKDIIQDVDYVSKPDGFDYYQFILWCMSTDRSMRVKIKDIEDNMRSLEEGKLKEKYKLAHGFLSTELLLRKAEKTIQKLRKQQRKSK